MPDNITTTQPSADMSYMFNNCGDLVCLNKLDTTNATNTSNIFYGCSALTAPGSTDQTNLENGASWTNPNSCP